MHKSFKFRLKPTLTQIKQFENVLDLSRQVYNAALQERIEAYKLRRKTLSKFDQINELPELRKIIPELAEFHRSILENVIDRVDKAYQAFFSRVKNKKSKSGFPRFKSIARYDSFTFSNIRNGFAVWPKYVRLPKFGEIKAVFERAIIGKPKIVTIKREVDQWFVIISCDNVPEKPLPKTGESVGIDVGLEYFATLSTGEHIDNPRHARKMKSKFRRAQRSLARKKKGSNRRKKQVMRIAKIHLKIKRQRRHFHFQIAAQLVRRFDAIHFEQLNIRNTIKNYRMAFSISDAAWNQFQTIVSFKVAETGKIITFGNARNTSNQCSESGVIKKKKLSERWHTLPNGKVIHRDHNAAINIKNRAIGAVSRQRSCSNTALTEKKSDFTI